MLADQFAGQVAVAVAAELVALAELVECRHAPAEQVDAVGPRSAAWGHLVAEVASLVVGRSGRATQPVGSSRHVAGGVIFDVRALPCGVVDRDGQALLRVDELEPCAELICEPGWYAATVVLDG